MKMVADYSWEWQHFLQQPLILSAKDTNSVKLLQAWVSYNANDNYWSLTTTNCRYHILWIGSIAARVPSVELWYKSLHMQGSRKDVSLQNTSFLTIGVLRRLAREDYRVVNMLHWILLHELVATILDSSPNSSLLAASTIIWTRNCCRSGTDIAHRVVLT